MNELKRRTKQAWRAARKHVPPKVAEAIRVPAKRVLRKLGVITRPTPTHRAAFTPSTRA